MKKGDITHIAEPEGREFSVSVEWGRKRLPKQFLNASQIFSAFKYLRNHPCEEFHAVYLDTKNRVIGTHMISRGSLTASLVHPREVFSRAVWLLSSGIVFIHQHPSGDPAPSIEDQELTNRLADAGHILGIEVIDHIIIGESSYVSFRERGLLR